MSAVGSSERVVHKDVGISSLRKQTYSIRCHHSILSQIIYQFLCKSRVILLFFGVESDILEEDHVTILQGAHGSSDCNTNYVRDKWNRLSQKLRQTRSNRS